MLKNAKSVGKLGGAILLVATALFAVRAENSADTTAAALAKSTEPENLNAGNTNLLRLHFRGAPLEMVLKYLSEAAGFETRLEVQPRGTLDVWSEQPLSRGEALEVLDAALLKNGYAAIQKGQTLTIVNRDEAKTRGLPVCLGADPGKIPVTGRLVTQVIPVRFTEVEKLMKDLQLLVPSTTLMTANSSANALIVTDTQATIHRVAQVVQALDSGAEDYTIVRVLRLKNADPDEMTEVLTTLFPDSTQSDDDTTSPMQFGGPGGGFGGPGPGGMFGTGSSQSASDNNAQRLKKRGRVVAVAERRTTSVVVTASKDMMPQIEQIVAELDANPAHKQTVQIYQLQNAAPRQLVKVLQDLFDKNGSSTRRTSSSETEPLETRSSQAQQSAATTSSRSGNERGGSTSGGMGGMGGGAP